MKNTTGFTFGKHNGVETVPFDTAEEAWLWFILAQEARNDGARFSAGQSLTARPCEPADILKCVDRLYRHRRLLIDHLLVLRHYGRRQMPPEPRRHKERRAYVLWEEALSRLEPVLISKGIVAENTNFMTPVRNCYQRPTIYEQGAIR